MGPTSSAKWPRHSMCALPRLKMKFILTTISTQTLIKKNPCLLLFYRKRRRTGLGTPKPDGSTRLLPTRGWATLPPKKVPKRLLKGRQSTSPRPSPPFSHPVRILSTLSPRPLLRKLAKTSDPSPSTPSWSPAPASGSWRTSTRACSGPSTAKCAQKVVWLYLALSSKFSWTLSLGTRSPTYLK